MTDNSSVLVGARSAFVVTATLVAGIACSSGHRAGQRRTHLDPPVLVPWNKVGDISLGERSRRVDADYGSRITRGNNRLHGGRFYVEMGRRVNAIWLGTPYYRTKTKFGVGSTIPFGRCHRTATARCEYRWHGFVWNAWVKRKPCECWVKVGRGRSSLAATTKNFLKPWTFIYTHRRRVTAIYLVWKFVD